MSNKCVFIKPKTHKLLKELKKARHFDSLSYTIFFLLLFYNRFNKNKQEEQKKKQTKKG